MAPDAAPPRFRDTLRGALAPRATGPSTAPVMRRPLSLPVRVALTLSAPALAGVLLLPAGAGVSLLAGCGACTAHVVAVAVSPPLPCVTVSPTVCNLGGEVVRIGNACPSALALSSPFFSVAGGAGPDGGPALAPMVVPPDAFLDLVATAAASGQNLLSISGVLGGAPISITIVVTDQDGGALLDAGDAALAATDGAAADASRPVKDAARGSASDGAKDAVKDAPRDGPRDATVDARSRTSEGGADAAPGVSDSATPG